MLRSFVLSRVFVLALLPAGCGLHSIVPDALETQVDQTVTFPKLIALPES